MRRELRWVVLLAGAGAIVALAVARFERAPRAARAAVPAAARRATHFALPLSFEENAGQVDAQVQFLAALPGGRIFLTEQGATFRLKTGEWFDMGPAGGQRSAPIAEEPLPGRASYFLGADPAQWRTGIRTFRRIRYPDVYPGVDLVFRGNPQALEYDFIVAPEADPARVRLRFGGVAEMHLTPDGQLRIELAGSRTAVVHARPRIYQRTADGVLELDGGYVVVAADEVGFAVADYDARRELIIDPSMVFSTYLGGSNGAGYPGPAAIAVDAAGNVYLAGGTSSPDFPSTGTSVMPFDGTYDTWVAKLASDGASLVYSTYIGGRNGGEDPLGVAVDSAGSAYVTGWTSSTDFPTINAVQKLADGGWDSFVLKLTPAGDALDYSTYLGGFDGDFTQGIAVDQAGSAYVAGFTRSANFPTANAMQPQFDGGTFDSFVAKLSPAGAPLVYSTFLGGSADENVWGIAVDGQGSAYVAGRTTSTNFPLVTPVQAVKGASADVFATKIDPSGMSIVYSTYLGGSGWDDARSIALDDAGSLYLTGYTDSTDFPTVNPIQATNRGGQDFFVVKLVPSGSSVDFATYLGGSSLDEGWGIGVDDVGNVSVTGLTSSTDFPTVNPVQATYDGGIFDAILAQLSPDGGTLVYSTYLGGDGDDRAFGLAVHRPTGNAYTTGITDSTNYLTVMPFQAVNPDVGGNSSVFLSMYGTPIPVVDAGPVADAGPSALALAVGCDCGSTPGGAGLFVLGAMAIAISGRRPRTYPSAGFASGMK